MDKHALICEDSLTSAHCIARVLGHIGYKYDIAQNTKQALEFLTKNKYDLMTLDILLPDKNGLEFIKDLQDIALCKNLPIIVISATKQTDQELKFPNNIVYWIDKSFDMSNFEVAVGDILNQKKQERVNILHVENDKDLLELIDITLSDIANVTPVNNLSEAKQILETSVFDIIILDYVFTEGTSDKLIPTIKSGVNKNAKLIMFSAYEESKMISRYFDKILIKTNISFDDFKDYIETVIDTKAEI